MFTEQKLKRDAIEAATAVKILIDIDPFRRKSIPKFSSDISIGRNRLGAAFKEITGMTLRRYRLYKRMEFARDLLASGQLSIKQVALQCEYKNPSNFTEDFKKIFEMTPANWLRTSR